MDTKHHMADSFFSGRDQYRLSRHALPHGTPQPCHDHTFYEVCIVESGHVRHYVNGQEQLIGRGAVAFLRPSDCHAMQAAGDSEATIINVMLRAQTADHLGERYGDEFGGRFFWSTDALPDTHFLSGPRIERAINTALELENSRRTLSRIEAFLLTLLTRVIDFSASVPTDAPRWLAAACHGARAPDVFRRGAAGFVAVAGRGHEHVCREARRHLGLSPSAIVNRIRMEHAAMRLSGSDIAVEAIAQECGIENLSYFYRLYRAHYGATPIEYRRRHRAMANAARSRVEALSD